MQRDMQIVTAIMKELAAYPGTSHPYLVYSGYAIVVHCEAKTHDLYEYPDSIAIPEKICSEETLDYHLDLMEEEGLVNKKKIKWELSRDTVVSCEGYRLSWDGNDFLNKFLQEGVLEEIESAHGDNWRRWGFDIAKSVVTKIAERRILEMLSAIGAQ